MYKINNLLNLWPLAFASTLLVNTVSADEVKGYVENTCAACHAMTKPNYEELGISERLDRKGPHLYYAGDKFNKEWLVSWLESPERIRPAGDFPPNHTIVTDEGDMVDESTLHEHIAVPKEMVEPVADYLMSLHLENAPQMAEEYTPKKVSPVMGRMNFYKFKGCATCHRDEPDSGGLSGPELYTAWSRLNPNFFITYVVDPVAWDPNTMMPNRHLKEGDVHQLVDYLKGKGE